MRPSFDRFRVWFHELPEKKKYIEVITASLTIPVLLSVFLINYFNIQDRKAEDKKIQDQVQPIIQSSPTIVILKEEVVVTPTPSMLTSPTLSPTGSPAKSECIRDLGPVAIRSPQEGAIISHNPLEIVIDYERGDYCSAVWSYRINDGQWSDYGDNDIQIYNLSSGKKTLELRIKSVVTDKNALITRTFTYQREEISPSQSITPSPTPILSTTP